MTRISKNDLAYMAATARAKFTSLASGGRGAEWRYLSDTERRALLLQAKTRAGKLARSGGV